jgi:hypothetical protein
VDTPLPNDVVAFTGRGRAALLDLARFMRHTADGGVGQALVDAKRELGAVLDADGKPLHSKWSIQRAWGGLLEMNRLTPADGVNSDTGRSLWVRRDGE